MCAFSLSLNLLLLDNNTRNKNAFSSDHEESKKNSTLKEPNNDRCILYFGMQNVLVRKEKARTVEVKSILLKL